MAMSTDHRNARRESVERALTEGRANVFDEARILRAEPGDILVFSGVPYECHDALLEWCEEHLPEGVRRLVFEDPAAVTLIKPPPRPRPDALMRCDGLTCTGCLDCVS